MGFAYFCFRFGMDYGLSPAQHGPWNFVRVEMIGDSVTFTGYAQPPHNKKWFWVPCWHKQELEAITKLWKRLIKWPTVTGTYTYDGSWYYCDEGEVIDSNRRIIRHDEPYFRHNVQFERRS